MLFKDYEYFFSEQRMGRYLAAAKGDVKLAKRLYRANLAISRAFHTALSSFEVCLRNQIYKQVAVHLNSPHWIIHEKRGFMSDPSLGHSFHLRSEVDRAEQKLRRHGRRANSGNVMAEQTLGFWVSLFEIHHYKLLKGAPIKAFQHLPAGQGRKEVCNALHEIRQFRNRIQHNEPVCFRGNRFDLSEATHVQQLIQDLARWMDPKFHVWISCVSKADNSLTRHLRTA